MQYTSYLQVEKWAPISWSNAHYWSPQKGEWQEGQGSPKKGREGVGSEPEANHFKSLSKTKLFFFHSNSFFWIRKRKKEAPL